MAEVGAISAPMERFEAAEPSQGLGGHRSLHRMKAACGPEGSRNDKHRVWCHCSIWISHVPGDQIVFRVDMTGGARNDPGARKLRIVQKSAALTDDCRRGIEAAYRQLAFEAIRTEIYHGQTIGNAVEDIETLRSRTTQRQAARATFVARISRGAGRRPHLDSSENISGC